MDPIIGLDVAKGESQVQAFLQRKEPYKKSFKFEHHLQGLYTFYQFYQEVEQVSEQSPAVIFESTGHYHEPVLQFLEDHDITYYLINPVVKNQLAQGKNRQNRCLPSGRVVLQRRFGSLSEENRAIPEPASINQATQRFNG